MSEDRATKQWIKVPGAPLQALALNSGSTDNPVKIIVVMDGKPVYRFSDNDPAYADKIMDGGGVETFCSMLGYIFNQREVADVIRDRGVQVVVTELPHLSKSDRGTVPERMALLKTKSVMVLAGYNVSRALLGEDLGAKYGRVTPLNIPLGRKVLRRTVIATLPLGDLIDPKPAVKGVDGGTVSLMDHFVEHMTSAILGKNRYDMAKDIPPGRPKFVMVNTMDKFERFMAAMRKCRIPSFDCETDNLSLISNRILMFQAALPKSIDDPAPKLYALPMRHEESPWTGDDFKIILRELRKYFEDDKLTDYTIWTNGKFDIGQLISPSGIGVRWFAHNVYDTQFGMHLLDENRRFIPKYIVAKPFSLKTLEDHAGYTRPAGGIDKDDRSNMASQTLKDMAEYGVLDVLTQFFLHKYQLAEARRRGDKNFKRFVIDQTGATAKVIARMELAGNLVDVDYLQSQALPTSALNKTLVDVGAQFRKSEAARIVNRQLTDEMGYTKEGLFGATKRPWVFSIRKPEHRDRLFFKVLKLAPVSDQKTRDKKTDKASVGKRFQDTYKLTVPEVAMLVEHAANFTLKTTFVDKMLRRLMEDPDAIADGAIRSAYSLLKVVSGRLSSFNVNLQNIPSRGKLAKLIKRMFIAEVGHILCKADFSAHEVRVLGITTGDEAILNLFRLAAEAKLRLRLAKTPEEVLEALANFKKQGDIHILNVKFMFGQEIDKKHPLRVAIKEAIFGLIYGMGPPALAAKLFTIFETEKSLLASIKKLDEKCRADPKDANAAAELRNVKENLRRKRMSEDEKVQEAQDLMDKLFAAWPSASGWMHKLQRDAARKLTVTSMLGRVRHLSGYLHSSRQVKGAMDRRGPNSSIQGAASEIATQSAHLSGQAIWKLLGPKQPLRSKLRNMVHDSQTHSAPLYLMPVLAYFVEHGMTSLVVEHYTKNYKLKFPVPMGIDMEFGFNEAEMLPWDDMRPDTMMKIGKELLTKAKASKAVHKAFVHNCEFIGKLRISELEKHDGNMRPDARTAAFWKDAIVWKAK